MRQAGTEVVIPKQTIALRGRTQIARTQIRGPPIPTKRPPLPTGAPPPQRLGIPGTVGYAANMVKGTDQDFR